MTCEHADHMREHLKDATPENATQDALELKAVLGPPQLIVDPPKHWCPVEGGDV